MVRQVSIFSGDQDQVAINGGWSSYVVSTSVRFNLALQNNTGNLDEIQYTRYFAKSGLYKVRFITNKQSDHGKVDLGINPNGQTKNNTNLFNQLDTYNLTQILNFVAENYIEIQRGYNDIHLKVNGKNASSSAFTVSWQALEFDLVQEYDSYQNDNFANGNLTRGLVPLGVHVAPIAESTFTFNFADVDLFNKYSEIIVEIHGEATASLALQAQINGISSANYYQSGYTSIGATLANVQKSAQTLIELLGTNIETSGAMMSCSMKIRIDKNNNYTYGEWFGGVIGGGNTSGMVGLAGIGSNNLISLTIKTSTSTWAIGTVISVWGVKKK